MPTEAFGAGRARFVQRCRPATRSLLDPTVKVETWDFTVIQWEMNGIFCGIMEGLMGF